MKSSKLKKKLNKTLKQRKPIAPPTKIHVVVKKKKKVMRDYSHEIDIRDLAS